MCVCVCSCSCKSKTVASIFQILPPSHLSTTQEATDTNTPTLTLASLLREEIATITTLVHSGPSPEQVTRLVARIGYMKDLPVTRRIVAEPGVGKALGALRKQSVTQVAEAASAVVEAWRASVS